MVVEIYQTCSDIAKTNAKSQKILNLMPKKKNLEDSKPRIIETIEKIYDKREI